MEFILLCEERALPDKMTSPRKIEAAELIVLLHAKSEEAFSVLYDSYSAVLLGIAFKMVNDRALAEDLLQDAFIKIWKSIDSYEPARSSLFTWMMRITRNTCIDHHRSKQARQQQQLGNNGIERVDTDTTDAHLAIVEEGKTIVQFTQWLGHKYKEVINLVYIHGYTQDEVATLLSLPLGTVKTRCHEGIKQLRRMHCANCVV